MFHEQTTVLVVAKDALDHLTKESKSSTFPFFRKLELKFYVVIYSVNEGVTCYFYSITIKCNISTPFNWNVNFIPWHQFAIDCQQLTKL